jgi:hypothetical protein
MTTVDLSAHRLAPLDIAVGGGVVYEIRPSADDLRRMGVFNAAAEQAIRASMEDSTSVAELRDLMDPEDYDMLDSNETMARVQLGDAAYERMVADGIPAPDIYAFGRYSMNYHTRGRAVADLMLGASDKQADTEGEPAFPKPSKSGRSTASASRTKTASTSATGRSRNTSGKSSTTGRK